MATIAMKRVQLIGMQRQRKKLLELVQRMGAVEVTEAAEAGFSRSDSAQMRAHLDRCTRTVQQALEILNRYAPEKKSLADTLGGARILTDAEFAEQVATHEEAIAAARKLTSLARKIAECTAEATRLQTKADALRPWAGLDVSLAFPGTAHTAALIGVLPEPVTLTQLLSRLAERIPEVDAIHAEIVSESPDQTAVFVLCIKEQRAAVYDALRAMGFAAPSVQTSQVPRAKIDSLTARRAQQDETRAALERQIVDLAPMRPRIEFLADYYASRKVKYQVIDRLAQSKNVFVLEGYIPQPAEGALERALEPYDAYVSFAEPDADAQPPVLLHNNRVAAPAETVVEMYSMPSKRDIDPTAIMAAFYYVLFGMMLSDAAYGILMAVGCGIVVKKFPRMRAELKKMLQMFFYCGISTAVWGVLFGGWFGDAPAVIARTFFHSDFTIPPLWFAPIDDPMRLLMFSFLVGIIHLYTGLGIQFYQLWRAGRKSDAIFDVGLWYGLITGLIVWLCSTELFQGIAGVQWAIPVGAVWAAQVVAAASAVGIILTAGRASHKPVIRLLKGVYGLYGVTSYLSDILSYSRLLALGLATGVIAQVINQMGSMLGGGVGGAILFVIVFLIGHTFNIGINLLGAYVHTNRLQYVEFFGKFYEGGGEPFRPFARTNEYIQLEKHA